MDPETQNNEYEQACARGLAFADADDPPPIQEGRSTVNSSLNPQEIIEDAIKKAATGDVGAAIEPHVVQALRQVKGNNPAEYSRIRKRFKDASKDISVKELDAEVKKDSEGDFVEQIDIARNAIAEIGIENIIFAASSFWTWRGKGVWKDEDDRSIKKIIHEVMDGACEITRGNVDSVLDLVRTEVFLDEHYFDSADPYIVNCTNGQLARRDGVWILEPHRREDYRTTQIPIDYDPNAKAAAFQKFLTDIFTDDADAEKKAQLIFEMIGYCLVSDSKRFEKYFMLYGNGSNRKSVLMEVIIALLGKDNVAAVKPSQFGNRFQRGYLHGMLANVVTELKEGELIDDGALKSIASGELDTAEHKGRDPFSFSPFCTCIFGANHLPHTRDFSDALFRRAIVIPFNRKYYETSDPKYKKGMLVQDIRLKVSLLRDLPGILTLAVNAFGQVMDRGAFTTTQELNQARQEWRMEADQVAHFIEDCCELVPDACTASRYLYDAYQGWAISTGIQKRLGQNSLTKRLRLLGVERSRDANERSLSGIRLASRR